MNHALPLWARFVLILPVTPLATAQLLPGAANPDAPVPLTTYRSVFVDTPTGVEQERADWKKANADVGQFRRGHVDLLKWEAQQVSPAARPAYPPAPASVTTPAAPPSAPHRH